MKDAGNIALLTLVSLMQALGLTWIRDVRTDLRQLRTEQQNQAVVIGALVTWAEMKGFKPYRF